jgi:cysteinyl-tRNA synthetase
VRFSIYRPLSAKGLATIHKFMNTLLHWRCAHALGRRRYTIKIKNTLVGGADKLQTGETKLKWYACGPTVYDDAHIGHARTYVNTDIVRRILSDYFKIEIDFAMGMTDIDDKIITRASEKSIDWKTLARAYENCFMGNLESLNVRRPDTVLRVTEHVDSIVAYIAHIIDQGKAYATPSGVYFDIAKGINSYGKLGNIPTAADSEDSADCASPASHKRDNRDFALWKIFNGESNSSGPLWDSPWGAGRPGWHIECSAMTHAYFGDRVDIHSGGIDLRFPHHTNEIAQR